MNEYKNKKTDVSELDDDKINQEIKKIHDTTVESIKAYTELRQNIKNLQKLAGASRDIILKSNNEEDLKEGLFLAFIDIENIYDTLDDTYRLFSEIHEVFSNMSVAIHIIAYILAKHDKIEPQLLKEIERHSDERGYTLQKRHREILDNIDKQIQEQKKKEKEIKKFQEKSRKRDIENKERRIYG